MNYVNCYCFEGRCALSGRTTRIANPPPENSALRAGVDWPSGGWGILPVDRSSFLFLGHPGLFPSPNRLLMMGRAMFTKQVSGGIV